MTDFLLRRVLQGIAIVFVVASLTFVLIHLAPGDPFSAIDDPRVTESVRETRRAQHGLDRPLGEQYVRYLGKVARGDFGESYAQSRPVRDIIGEALPRTLLLMSVALTIAFALGVGIGVVQALRHGSPIDRTLSGLTLVVTAIPEFWLAVAFMLAFAYRMPIFPVAGMTDDMHWLMPRWQRVTDIARHLVLPSLTLGLAVAAQIARYQRTALLDVLPEDWTRTARAKGLSEKAVVVRHALRNALLPVITLFGLALPALIGGAVFVETIFSWPGMGRVAVDAIASRDYPVVVADVIVASVMVVAGSVVADLLYALADPRLRAT